MLEYWYIERGLLKAIEQYFHALLFIMLYKAVLTLKSVDETLVCDLDTKKTTPNIEVWPESLGAMLEYWYIERGLLKTIEQYFHLILFIMLFKVFLTFQSVDKFAVSNYSLMKAEWFLAFKSFSGFNFWYSMLLHRSYGWTAWSFGSPSKNTMHISSLTRLILLCYQERRGYVRMFFILFLSQYSDSIR